MIDNDFINEYVLLLIKEYWEKPNAKAEITLQASTWSEIYTLYNMFDNAFDIDLAEGNQLDIIGKIVGIPRTVPFALDKIRFGFDGDSSARGFADLFDADIESAPFLDLFESEYTDYQLDDNDYRFFIKAKISKNIVSAYMASDNRVSIQDSIQLSFDGLAYVTDNQDMTLTLYVSPGIDEQRILLIRSLDLLPKPQGVRYKLIIGSGGDFFGFDDDPQALGFGDVFDDTVGGQFASLII